MANRRVGGMGAPHRGNRPFSQLQPFQGNNVSPWQGNAPSNNSVNQGLISQITSNPQLALALTSLLHPQQQQMNNPPSLLSMNQSRAYSNQDRDINHFGSRGRDFRRHEPYSKGRNGSFGGSGWRPMDNNRNRNRAHLHRDRRPSPMVPKDKARRDQREPPKKKPENNVTPVKAALDESRDEETPETKRDWKAEKNAVPESPQAKPEVKPEAKPDAKPTPKQPEAKKADPRTRAGKYYDVPVKFLNCFVCNKEMWDGESMQKHIRGRAHKQMLNSLEESIHITVNILRENMRLAEEKKVIEWNRMHRLKKFTRNEPESHCNMCDLKFMGVIISHRKTEGHQRLKRYLHPNCYICSKEFPSRIEWVEHRLTPEHMRKLYEVLETKAGGADGAIIENENDLDIEPLLDESLQMENDTPILELTDDLAGLQNVIPAYKKDRAVSTKSLVPYSGFLCELCNRSFATNEMAQNHLKTRRHYYAFIEAAKDKYQKNLDEAKRKPQAKNKSEKSNANDTTNDEENDLYDPEEACNEEEAANDESLDETKDVSLDETVQEDKSEASVIKEETLIETVEVEDDDDEEEEEEEKEEVASTPTPVTPTVQRVLRRPAGANKPGPKCKKTRKL